MPTSEALFDNKRHTAVHMHIGLVGLEVHSQVSESMCRRKVEIDSAVEVGIQ